MAATFVPRQSTWETASLKNKWKNTHTCTGARTHTERRPGSLGEPEAAPTINTLILPHTSHEEAARQKDAGCAPDKAPSRTAGVKTPDFHLTLHGNKTELALFFWVCLVIFP